MKCRFCGEEMNFVYCDDNGGGGADVDIAYNLYSCDDCMSTLREDVWNFSGQIWIKDGEVIVIPKEK